VSFNRVKKSTARCGARRYHVDKIVSIVCAAVFLMTFLISGTFAWSDYEQHKTNAVSGSAIYDASTPVTIYANLTITKTVQNDDESELTDEQLSREFLFTVTFSDDGSYRYAIDSGNDLILTSGDKISLSHGQTAVIKAIPAGTVFSVVEEQTDGYMIISENSRDYLHENGAICSFINIYMGSDFVDPSPTPIVSLTPTPTPAPPATPIVSVVPTPTPAHSPEPTMTAPATATPSPDTTIAPSTEQSVAPSAEALNTPPPTSPAQTPAVPADTPPVVTTPDVSVIPTETPTVTPGTPYDTSTKPSNGPPNTREDDTILIWLAMMVFSSGGFLIIITVTYFNGKRYN